MVWLVTGGAGYIGSHVVHALIEAGITPAVLDDFSTGQRSFIPEDVTVYHGTLLDEIFLEKVFTDSFEGVIHLAGYKYAGQSVHKPLLTYEQNVTATVNLLRAFTRHEITAFVFSSSASVYGTPDVDRVIEETALKPESPYGESKLIGEWLVNDVIKCSGIRATSLRYFNVVGSGHSQIVDLSPYNLFPLLFRALEAGETPHINGDDFETPDGTCVRDYVHVSDIARAHVVAAQLLSRGVELQSAYNLGAGTGTSVRQIMESAQTVTGIDFVPEVRPRRPGDPAQIVATGELASRDLAWKNTFTIEEMLESAWSAWGKRSNDITK